MSRTITIFLPLIVCLTIGVHLSGQQKAAGKQPGKGTASKKIFMPPVYFGNSDYRGGPIRKDKFGEWLAPGLSAHDSLGNKYKIVGFEFSYAEQKIYEDSIGNIVKMVDFSSEYCPGNMISSDITSDNDTSITGDVSVSIYRRVKPGDTVYFDHIMLQTNGPNSLMSIPDSVSIMGRPIKSYIVK